MPASKVTSMQQYKLPYIQLSEALIFSELSPVALKIYAGLESYARGRGECWPSLSTLSERLKLSVRHIQRGLQELEKEGLLELKRGTGRTPTRYILPSVAWRGSHPRGDSSDTVAWRGSHPRGDMTDSRFRIPMAVKPYESESLNHIHESWANRPESEALKAGANQTEPPPIPRVPPHKNQLDLVLMDWLKLSPAKDKLKHFCAVGEVLEVKFVSSVFNEQAVMEWLDQARLLYPTLTKMEVL